MRVKRYIYIMLIISILLFAGSVRAIAIDTGFLTGEMPQSKKDMFINYINISLTDEEPPRKAIECFDVNLNGQIAIGSSNFESKTISVYATDGEFQYAYNFKCDGKFGVEWHDDKLFIYFVRSDVAVAVDATGKIGSVLEIENTPENHAYWNDCVFAVQRRVGNTEYMLKNDMGILNIFASNYSQLVCVDPEGGEFLLYDVNSTQLTSAIVILIGGLVFVCIVLLVVVRQFHKAKHYKHS